MSGLKLPGEYHAALNLVREARVPAVSAVIVACVGSSPQKPGARILLAADGQVAGTVGGGAIEHRLLADAEALLAATMADEHAAPTRLVEYNLSRDLGMCCGGTMTAFLERVQCAPRLVVLGAGHIATHLALLARTVGFDVTVIDEREQWADDTRFPEGVRVVCDDPEAAVAELVLDRDTAVVVVTHHHPLDQALVRALTTSRAGFCGLVGSEAKRNKFVMRLKAQGASEEALRSLRSPLGVQIGAASPEEIALSIVAELVAWRRGVTLDDGVPVRAKRQRAETDA